MWRIGVIGAGYISDMHLRGWSLQHNVKIAALCDLNSKALYEKALQFNIDEEHCYTDVDRMLANEDLDIIDITAGPAAHLPLVRKAAAAGKHILCQKPFAPDLEQAQEMVSLARKAGVKLMVTENWRWLSVFRNVKTVLDAGLLGNIYFVKYNTLHYFTPMLVPGKPIKQPYFRDMPRLLMYEMGTHWFDVWRYLFGEPQRLYAELRSVSPYVIGDDVGTVLIGHDRFHGLMDMSWASRRGKGSELMFIEADRNALKVLGNGSLLLIDETGEKPIEGQYSYRYEDSFRMLQTHFLECLESGGAFETNGEDNLKSLRLALSVYDSAADHQAIQF